MRLITAAGLVVVALLFVLLPRGSAALAPQATIVFGQSGLTTTVAGTSETAVSSPGAVVIDWTDGRVFVADTGNNRVISWATIDEYEVGDEADVVHGQPDFASSTANNPAAPIGGLGARSLSGPSSLAIDKDGRLYVSDTGNNRVLVFAPPFSSAMAATIVLGQSSLTANAATQPPTASSLRGPAGIAVDEHGSLVVADKLNNRVVGYMAPVGTGQSAYLLVGQTLFTTSTAGLSELALNGPSGVGVAEHDTGLWVADTGNNRVLFFPRETEDGSATYVYGQASFTTNSAGTGASALSSPAGLMVDAYQRLFVADRGNSRVLVYSDPLNVQTADVAFGTNGSLTSAGGGAGAGGLNAPVGLGFDSNDNVMIVDAGNNRVLGYAAPLPLPVPTIHYVEPGTVPAGTTGPLAVAIDGLGMDDDATVAVNGTTRPATVLETGGLQIELTTAELASVGTLNITVTARGLTSAAAALEVYTPGEGDASADEVVGEPDFSSREGYFRPPSERTMVEPGAMVVAPGSGRVFLADSGSGRVLSWASAAAMTDGQAPDLLLGQPNATTIANYDQVPSASIMAYPIGLAVDTGGNLYVSDEEYSRVLIFRAPLTSGMAASVVIGQPSFTSVDAPTTPSAANLSGPLGVAVDASGNLYVADGENSRVLQYDAPLTTGMAATRVFGQGGSFTSSADNLSGVSASSLAFPFGLTVDTNGSLWVVDEDNHRVLRFDSPRTSDTVADLVLGQSGSFTSQAENNGGPLVGFSSPDGVTVDSSGNVWVADAGNNRVVRFSAPVTAATRADLVLGGSTAQRSRQALAAGGPSRSTLKQPGGVVVDSSGKVLVVDTQNSRVVAYNRPAQVPILRRFIPNIGKGSGS